MTNPKPIIFIDNDEGAESTIELDGSVKVNVSSSLPKPKI